MTDFTTVRAENLRIKGQIGKRGLAVLLHVQQVLAGRGAYSYVEIGSYLGRTLYMHIVESACRKALSIDLRPDVARDERGDVSAYKGITADDMIAQLAQHCSQAQLKKLETITDTSDALQYHTGVERFDLALIDGEHTNTAVFQDFLNLRRVMAPDSIVVFDDSHVVLPGIQNAIALLKDAGVEHHAAYCLGALTVVGMGELAELVRKGLPEQICISQAKAERRYRNNIADRTLLNELPGRLARNPHIRAKVEKIMAA